MRVMLLVTSANATTTSARNDTYSITQTWHIGNWIHIFGTVSHWCELAVKSVKLFIDADNKQPYNNKLQWAPLRLCAVSAIMSSSTNTYLLIYGSYICWKQNVAMLRRKLLIESLLCDVMEQQLRQQQSTGVRTAAVQCVSGGFIQLGLRRRGRRQNDAWQTRSWVSII